MKVFVILHNIRSMHNAGSIFRTAEGLGAKKIYLTGYTPSPYDFFGKLHKDFAKTALGAEKYLEWEKVEASLPSRCGGITAKAVKNIFALITRLKQDGVQIVALEQSKNSLDLKKFSLGSSASKLGIALILGNEVTGLSKPILKKCDRIIEIPMRGKKESLNVSVAAGIALWEITNLPQPPPY